MPKIILLICLGVFHLISYAQTPFAGCENAFYLLSGNGGGANQPITLHTIDTTSLATATFGSTIPLHIDGAGYNQVDNFIYGFNDDNDDGTPNLHRIDATGAQTLIAEVSPPIPGPGDFGAAVLWGVGDIDQNGIYHFPGVIIHDIGTADYDIYLGKIDLSGSLASPISPNYMLMTTGPGGCQPLIDAFVADLINFYINGGPEPDGGIQDWAFNPNDGMLYSYLGVEGYVFQLQTNAEANCFPTSNGAMTQFGGIFFDRSGDMNGYESVTGNSFNISYDNCPGAACGTLTAGAQHTVDQRLDAASCPWALPIVLEPFPGCINYGVLTLAPSGGVLNPTTLYSADTTAFSLAPFGNQLPVQMNGLGFNYVDNFLYAMNDPDESGSPDLYRIDVNGNSELVTEILPPTPGPGALGSTVLWLVGDIDETGIYHFPAVVVNDIATEDYTIYLGTIDLAAVTTPTHMPTYVTLAAGSCQTVVNDFVTDLILYNADPVNNPEPEGGIQDWAFNPIDSMLYSYLGFESLVFRMDPATATAECFPTANPSLTQFSGVFFDASGDMYAIENGPGLTYMIDISTCPAAPCGTLIPMTPAVLDMRGDAASCPWKEEILPLELTLFRGTKDRYDIDLDWTTSFEADIVSFKVERSSNAIDFTAIGEIRAVGNSNQANSYKFRDENPLPALNYYRLTYIDAENNAAAYHHLVVIDMGKGSLYFTINPNPTDETINILMQSASSTEIQVEIFDLAGKKLLETSIQPFNLRKEIEVEHLSPGMYLLKTRNGINGYVQRFVKL